MGARLLRSYCAAWRCVHPLNAVFVHTDAPKESFKDLAEGEGKEPNGAELQTLGHLLQDGRRLLLDFFSGPASLSGNLEERNGWPRASSTSARGSPAYLSDDMVHLVRLENDALQGAGFARFHSFVQNWRVTPEGISQVTGMPPLFQNVLKIIPFL